MERDFRIPSSLLRREGQNKGTTHILSSPFEKVEDSV
jgi:hypothetical protein